jgi:hypothetical protein
LLKCLILYGFLEEEALWSHAVSFAFLIFVGAAFRDSKR